MPKRTFIALQTCHGTFVSALSDGTMEVTNHCQSWEFFQLLENQDGTRSLLTAHKKYVSAREDGKMAQAPHCKECEKFRIQRAAGKLAFLTVHGTYLSAWPDKPHIRQQKHLKSWEQFCLLRDFVRVFDLGGSGLKTAVCYVAAAGECGSRAPRVISSSKQNLGQKRPDSKYSSICRWVRDESRLGNTIECELKDGWLIGASVAGVDKLWADYNTTTTERGSFSDVLGIPTVASLHDGSAHMLASLKALKDSKRLSYPMCNIAIGTALVINFTNSKGEIRSDGDMKELFKGKPSWDFEVKLPRSEGQKQMLAYKAFGGSFDGNVRDHPNNAKRQADRWYCFLTEQLPQLFKDMGWTPPSCFAFTGGVSEHSDVVDRLKKMGINAHKGPADAGLLGAAWHAWKTGNKS